jgi:hypothetical protein
MKLTTHLIPAPKSSIVELYFYFSIRPHGLVLNELKAETTLLTGLKIYILRMVAAVLVQGPKWWSCTSTSQYAFMALCLMN